MSLARAGTDTQAANLALAHLGQPAMADILQPGVRARAMRRFFAAARDASLREKWWSFAKSWVRPSADTTASLGPLTTRYALPADCLRVRYLDDGAGGVFDDESGRWDIEGGAIDIAGATVEGSFLVTDADAPLVAYTRRVETVSLWDPVFLMGFSYRLAGMAAPLLRQSARAGALEAKALEVFDTASAIDSKETSVGQTRPTPSFLTARRGLRSRLRWS